MKRNVFLPLRGKSSCLALPSKITQLGKMTFAPVMENCSDNDGVSIFFLLSTSVT